MSTTNNEFTSFAETEIKNYVIKSVKGIKETRATELSKDIVAKIDWDNSALMHKGFSWITKSYLAKINLL